MVIAGYESNTLYCYGLIVLIDNLEPAFKRDFSLPHRSHGYWQPYEQVLRPPVAIIGPR